MYLSEGLDCGLHHALDGGIVARTGCQASLTVQPLRVAEGLGVAKASMLTSCHKKR